MSKRWDTLRRYVVIGLGLLAYILVFVKKIFIREDMHPTQQKSVTILLVIGGIVLGLLFSMLLYSRYVVWAIKSPKRFQREVGYQLPENARIVYTKAHVFSLVDGPNYTWLVTSESSLRSWAARRGIFDGPGPGGWSHIQSFYEVAPYNKDFERLVLDSVWKVHATSAYDDLDTSYIFLAGNHRVALIKTFRP